MGTHPSESPQRESFPMNTNMTGFIWLSKILRTCDVDESCLSIERDNVNNSGIYDNLAKYLKRSHWFSSDKHFSFISSLLCEMYF